jgi:hypothetical protein
MRRCPRPCPSGFWAVLCTRHKRGPCSSACEVKEKDKDGTFGKSGICDIIRAFDFWTDYRERVSDENVLARGERHGEGKI